MLALLTSRQDKNPTFWLPPWYAWLGDTIMPLRFWWWILANTVSSTGASYTMNTSSWSYGAVAWVDINWYFVHSPAYTNIGSAQVETTPFTMGSRTLQSTESYNTQTVKANVIIPYIFSVPTLARIQVIVPIIMSATGWYNMWMNSNVITAKLKKVNRTTQTVTEIATLTDNTWNDGTNRMATVYPKFTFNDVAVSNDSIYFVEITYAFNLVTGNGWVASGSIWSFDTNSYSIIIPR